MTVAAWSNPSNYFRRSVRLFNAEDLQTTAAPRAVLTNNFGDHGVEREHDLHLG